MSGNDFTTAGFFTYVRGRRRRMAVGGVVLLVGGLIAMGVAPDSLTAWFAALALVGLLLVAGQFAGARMLRHAHDLLGTPPRTMELTTWPTRSSGRALFTNQVKVTLDIAGSTQRQPLAEFKATWFTPDTAESPTRPAQVFGSLQRGQTVLAVTAEGDCYLGRLQHTRDATP